MTQGVHGSWQSGEQLPVSGIYVPTPVFGDTPLAIDLRQQYVDSYGSTRIRITVDYTQDQIDDPLANDGILYCCGETTGLDFAPGFQFDEIRMVPDVIGVGFSVEERINPQFPILYLTSRNDRASEVRIRAI